MSHGQTKNQPNNPGWAGVRLKPYLFSYGIIHLRTTVRKHLPRSIYVDLARYYRVLDFRGIIDRKCYVEIPYLLDIAKFPSKRRVCNNITNRSQTHMSESTKPQPKIKNIIFDFDGTIADSLDTAEEIMVSLAKRFGVELKPNYIETVREHGMRGVIKELRIGPFKLLRILRAFRKSMADKADEYKTFPETLTLLEQLHEEGITMAVVTNSTEKAVEIFCKKHNIHYFKFVKANWKMFGKSTLLSRLMRKHKMDPAETMYVGDETPDITASQKAGIRSGAAGWGNTNIKSLAAKKPSYIFKRPKDILKVV